MAAQHAVFDTYELLEQIISHLPAPTIHLSAKLVSKTWNSVISKSSLLQRHAVLTPSPPASKFAEYMDLKNTPSFPCYDYGVRIDFHPALSKAVINTGKRNRHHSEQALLLIPNFPRMVVDVYDEPIVVPRCCAVGVQLSYPV